MAVYVCRLKKIKDNPFELAYMARRIPIISENRDRFILEVAEGSYIAVGKYRVFPKNKCPSLKRENSTYVSGEENIPLLLDKLVQQELEEVQSMKDKLLNDTFNFKKEVDTVLPTIKEYVDQLENNQLGYVEIAYSPKEGYTLTLEKVEGYIEETSFCVTKGLTPMNKIPIDEIGELLPRDDLYEVTFFTAQGRLLSDLNSQIAKRMKEDRKSELKTLEAYEKALRGHIEIVHIKETVSASS